MSILERFFGGKTSAITSDIIRAEVARCAGEIAALHANVDKTMAGLATMTDNDHVAAEAAIATSKRAIARLDARIAYLTDELPKVIAAEEAAATVAADEALRQRAEASRKANGKESAKLLNDYEKLADTMAGVLGRLVEIADETNAVNAELHKNQVAELVTSYSSLYRKTPDRSASTRTEARPCYVYSYPGSPRDTEKLKFVQLPATEEVREATIGPNGKPYPAQPVVHDHYGRKVIIHPRLETRNVVVEQTHERRGYYEAPLSEIQLPPAYAGGKQHWPRPSAY